MAYVSLRNTKVWSIDVSRKWTVITIKIPTATLAGQGALKALGKRKGEKVFQAVHRKARAHAAKL
jgi:hypothetical protein